MRILKMSSRSKLPAPNVIEDMDVPEDYERTVSKYWKRLKTTVTVKMK